MENTMIKEFKGLERLKKYDIRVEFKNTDDIENLQCNSKEALANLQMLIFFNDELVYATKKKSFYVKEVNDYKIKLNKYYLPKYHPIKYNRIKLEEKRYKSFIGWCTNLRQCVYLQELVTDKLIELSNECFK